MTDRPGSAPFVESAIAPSTAAAAMDPERARIAEGTADQPGRWWAFGPYVSERAWGTVREDYSADGRAWDSFPHDHARSRAYRWSEDGLAGMCDVEQRLCFALSFWNGRDPILKERIFGLTGTEGNHGEDAKEYWWYVDATPSASWLRWRYYYPHDAFPYATLVSEGRRRTRADREFELADTGHLRARPLLGNHRRLRQGNAGRHLYARENPQRGCGGGDAARAPDSLVSNRWSLVAERGYGVHGRREVL